jgi:hypothetical protein
VSQSLQVKLKCKSDYCGFRNGLKSAESGWSKEVERITLTEERLIEKKVFLLMRI